MTLFDIKIVIMKRSNVLTWNDYFMYIAKLSAMRSKDPRIQVGACIVDEENRISGIGYNGMPRGCHDDEFPWYSRADAKTFLDSKHAYVCHAEVNAIMNCGHTNLKNNSMYCTHYPCNECAKLIIQSGIRNVIYLEEHRPNEEPYLATQKMFRASGVNIIKLFPTFDKIEIYL